MPSGARGFIRLATICVIGIGLIGTLGCGSDSREAFAVVGEASSAFPDESLTDWRSYADHLAVVSVVRERELAMDAESAANKEGIIPRVVDVQVDETVWSAPNAPALPDEFTVVVEGWVLSDGQRQELRIGGRPRTEVGQTLLAPMLRVERPRVEWGPMTEPLPLEDRRVAAEPGDTSTALRRALTGKTAEEVAVALRAAPPDPIAEQYRDLRPRERARAVLLEKRSR